MDGSIETPQKAQVAAATHGLAHGIHALVRIDTAEADELPRPLAHDPGDDLVLHLPAEGRLDVPTLDHGVVDAVARHVGDHVVRRAMS